MYFSQLIFISFQSPVDRNSPFRSKTLDDEVAGEPKKKSGTTSSVKIGYFESISFISDMM